MLVCVKSVDVFLVRSPRFSLRAMALRCEGSLRAVLFNMGQIDCLFSFERSIEGVLGGELGGGLYGVGWA